MSRPVVHMIDDDPSICAETVEALRARGYTASWSQAPFEGRMPSASPPDVLILDLSMPDTDGFEIIEMIGRTGAAPSLIVASGHRGPIVEAAVRSAEAAALPVLGALEKPFTVKQLVTLLDAYDASSAPSLDVDSVIQRLIAEGSLLKRARTAFQSKRRLVDGKISGYEALLRLPSIWPIDPGRLFSSDVNPALQLALTGQVMQDAAGFARTRTEPVPMSINVPPPLLCEDSFLPMIEAVSREQRLPPSQFIFEVTENDAGRPLDQIAAAASRLAMRGFGISIDDFGRGSTSLDRLIRLPLTEVKIDREIFWAAAAERFPRTILEGIVAFCKDHGISSTIEGIETEDQLSFARSLGASHGQGFLFERPFFPAGDQPSAPNRSSGVIK